MIPGLTLLCAKGGLVSEIQNTGTVGRMLQPTIETDTVIKEKK